MAINIYAWYTYTVYTYIFKNGSDFYKALVTFTIVYKLLSNE